MAEEGTINASTIEIAVCICTRDRPSELRGALKSVSGSRLRPRQVIVSDDSDDDNSALNRAVVAEFPAVRYIRGPRRGLCANRNSALRLIEDDVEWIQFLDDDARLHPSFFSEVLTGRPHDKVIVSGAELRDGELISPGNPSFWGHQEKVPRGESDTHAVNITATLFPASLFSRLSFDENLQYGSDEADICGRAEALGFRIVFRPQAVVTHRRSAVGRAQYGVAAETARIYSTFRRYRWVRGRPFYALCYLTLAPAHLMLSRVARFDWAGLTDAWVSCRGAVALVRREAQRHRTRLVGAPQAALHRVQPVRLSVIVPSYGRPGDLTLCLESLIRQQRAPDEVVVAVRNGDRATSEVVQAFSGELPTRVALVERPGQVAALNAALATCTGDVVAITDDDASPRSDWLARIEAHFRRDRAIGGVGGRDVVAGNTDTPVDTARVGRIQWFGRIMGHHHRGTGFPRYVDVLKGANMSFDRRAIDGLCFDDALRGSGAQVHNDLGLCLSVRRRGWPLVYDPLVVVDHRVGERVGGDARGFRGGRDAFDPAFNETLLLLRDFSPGRRITYLAWALVVGTRGAPGLLQLARASGPSPGRVLASLSGRAAATKMWLSHRASEPSRPQTQTP